MEKDNKYYSRKFRFGRKYEIIVDETNEPLTSPKQQTIIYLNNLYSDKHLDKELETIARKLLERLLIFFINEKFTCPKIILKESDNSKQIILNDYLQADSEIQLLHTEIFELENSQTKKIEKFTAKIFKIYFSKSESKIILTAHNREVTESALHLFVPEFEDEFFDEFSKGGKTVKKNYVVKTYVLGDYLDSNVSVERESFNFSKDKRINIILCRRSQSKKRV